VFGAVSACALSSQGRRQRGVKCVRQVSKDDEKAWHARYAPPVVFDAMPSKPVRFDPTDPAAIEHLQDQGYVLFANVLSPSEVDHATDLFWDFIHETCDGRVRRDEPETWGCNWPGESQNGIINCGGIGQSPFMWYVRTRPRVLEAFASVWGVPRSDLVISFDGACAFRPPAVNPAWRTRNGWFHTDQNGITNGSAFTCAQAFVSLTSNDETTGGFAVIPGSHHRHPEIFTRWPLSRTNDFFVLPRSDPILLDHNSARVLHVCAGDLILWDSRCLHCNVPARHPFDELPLRDALEAEGLTELAEPVSQELTSVADAAWVAATATTIQLPAGLSHEALQALDALCNRWAAELAETVAGPRQLLRLVAYVCAMPRWRLDANQLRMKRCAALLGATTTHWPDRQVILETGLGQRGQVDVTDMEISALRLIGCEAEDSRSAFQELANDARALAAPALPQFGAPLLKLAERLSMLR